jgi:hypothetical protein
MYEWPYFFKEFYESQKCSLPSQNSVVFIPQQLLHMYIYFCVETVKW